MDHERFEARSRGDNQPKPLAERARPLARSALGRRALRSKPHRLRWKARSNELYASLLSQAERRQHAAALDVSPSHTEHCASASQADIATLDAWEIAFMPPEARRAFLAALEEWGSAIDRGEL